MSYNFNYILSQSNLPIFFVIFHLAARLMIEKEKVMLPEVASMTKSFVSQAI